MTLPETRAEDLAWMAECGESLTGAAGRLGISRITLEKWVERNTPDLLASLRAHEPCDWNGRTGGGNQWVSKR